MKSLFIAFAFCFLAAFAFPEDSAITNEESFLTTPEPKKHHSKQGNVEGRTRLLKELFEGYNKKVNPDSIKLRFGVNLIDFSVCEEREVLESSLWLKYVWDDPRLTWEPKEFGGATVIRLDPEEIWTPDVTLYNSADPVNMVNCWKSNVLIYSSGEILWVPPCKIVTQCSFNLRRHPYGEQKCHFKFGSWTFDGTALDIQLYNKTVGLDLSELNNSSGFEIVENTAERHDKFYSCCEEAYPDLTFNFTLKRIPGEELFKGL